MKGLFYAMLVGGMCELGMTGLARAQTITVPGTSNIFGAGHKAAPNPSGEAGECGSLLTILATGSITGGTQYTSTNVSATGGISDIAHSARTMFLVGVFLSATEPSGAGPVSLTYNLTTVTQPTYSPLLNQTFFIGDGRTGTGTGDAQVFTAPVGATRLFLGFADSFNSSPITGLPGFYGDNGGSLSARISTVLEPSAVFTGLALLGLAGFRERRRSRCGSLQPSRSRR